MEGGSVMKCCLVNPNPVPSTPPTPVVPSTIPASATPPPAVNFPQQTQITSPAPFVGPPMILPPPSIVSPGLGDFSRNRRHRRRTRRRSGCGVKKETVARGVRNCHGDHSAFGVTWCVQPCSML
ncbi:hypothetical protein O6P43_011288 [Quillaja saponaria]|uniref:Uncharacterized protein n=1 Tax=Quillaja saponaria TaxID=32244 RepID=A0AAD7VF66_QUISA|nr:hypothetical protein O6P43_011288 [Quillaja saponaria]